MTPSLLKVGIYGLGLIGGSLAKALRKSGEGITLYGYDRRKRRVKMALDEKVISKVLSGSEVAEMDVIFLAIPVLESLDAAQKLIEKMKKGSILTDCGSVKQSLCREMEGCSGDPWFVGGHPIAGTEKSGYENSFPELFKERVVFITPFERTPRDKVETVRSLWKKTGARVLKVDAKYHDHVFAFVSHLPHAVAYSLVHAVATFDSRLPLGYSAGGFKDFTRIASSNPVMWTDIMVENRDEILRALTHYRKSFTLLEDLIRKGDVEGMKEYFRLSKKKRDSI